MTSKQLLKRVELEQLRQVFIASLLNLAHHINTVASVIDLNHGIDEDLVIALFQQRPQILECLFLEYIELVLVRDGVHTEMMRRLSSVAVCARELRHSIVEGINPAEHSVDRVLFVALKLNDALPAFCKSSLRPTKLLEVLRLVAEYELMRLELSTAILDSDIAVFVLIEEVGGVDGRHNGSGAASKRALPDVIVC